VVFLSQTLHFDSFSQLMLLHAGLYNNYQVDGYSAKYMHDYSFRASVRCRDMLRTNHLVYANPRHTSNWKSEDHVHH